MGSLIQRFYNLNAEWELATPLTMSKFKAEVGQIMRDTSIALMGLEFIEVSVQSYATPVYYHNAADEEKSKIVLNVRNCEAHLDTLSFFTDDSRLVNLLGGGTGSTATSDLDEAVWTAKLRCKKGDDYFQIVFHRTYLVLMNYSNDETVEAVESYLATRPNLAQKED